MKFSTVVALLAVAGSAYANKHEEPKGNKNVCSTGTAQCCQHLTNDASQISALNTLLGPISDVAGHVGVQCVPVGVLIGVPITNNCKANVACCTGQSQNGLVQTGCTPINLA